MVCIVASAVMVGCGHLSGGDVSLPRVVIEPAPDLKQSDDTLVGLEEHELTPIEEQVVEAAEHEGLSVIYPHDPTHPGLPVKGILWPLVVNEGAGKHYETEMGLASFYWQGQRLATGERFDPDGMSAAHKTLPFGTVVRCTWLETGASVVVTINDRGPYIRGRIIDLSRGAARKLGMTKKGVVPVRVDVLAYPLVETMGPRGNG